MGKTKKFKIEIEEKPKRIGHIPHRSGSGIHNDKPKRTRTRERQKKQWNDDNNNLD